MKNILLFIYFSLWFLNFSTRTILSPLLPIIEDELNLNHALAGSLIGIMSGGYTFTLLIAGFVSVRIGYKNSLMIGFLLMTVALFSINFATTYGTIGLCLFLIGMGSGIYMPSMVPLITATFEQRNWGKVLAIHETAAPGSIFLVPLAVAFSLNFLHWRSLFSILSLACFMTITLFSVLSPNPRPQSEEKMSFTNLLGRKEFWIMATLWIFAAASNLGLYSVIPLFLVHERHIMLEEANTIFGISRAGGLIVTLVAGFSIDRFGIKKIICTIFLVSGIATMGVALFRNLPLLIISLILQATVLQGFFPVGLVTISRLTTLKERGFMTAATMSGGMIIGVGLTPVVIGAVADIWDFERGIFVLGLMTILVTLSLGKLPRL